jgi:pantoate--beta-alanine ligase
MDIVRSVTRMQKIARGLSRKGSIGLVPTMGFLHEGHLSLIRRARAKSDFVIVSIFVNPAQFAPEEDFGKYPRDERGDVKKIRGTGADIVFIPGDAEIYPDDFQTYVMVESKSRVLEGKSRPSHFRGVTTIVAKLFDIVRPDLAVFGQKDYQQAVVIRQMVRDLAYPVRIITAPTVREKDGLAMSSRNKYFDREQRKEAICLYRALKKARDMVKKEGIRDTGNIRRAMDKVIRETSPSAEIDYIAFTEYDSLKQVRRVDKNTICSLAIRVHGVRLIDNLKIS